MFRKHDPYAYIESRTLYLSDGSAIGVLETEYQVSLYNDVQVLTVNSAQQSEQLEFILTCKHRILIQNSENALVSLTEVTDASQEAFENYPALLNLQLSFEQADSLAYDLLDYSPKTVNTAVQQSSAAGSDSSQSLQSSSTTGNSYSQSSSYGFSVTAGDSFSGVSSNYEYTTSSTQDQSKTTGSDSSSSEQSSTTDSMSIKDWGSYCGINPLDQSPTWLFGQEMPWNAISCRFATATANPNGNSNQLKMCISDFMSANLYDGNVLYPPTELSMYGLNFLTKAVWRMYVDKTSGPSASCITINPSLLYYTASHYLETQSDNSQAPAVYLDRAGADLYVLDDERSLVAPSTTLDLSVMGLDPIGMHDSSAIVGFISNNFIPPAASDGSLSSGFRVLATTNDLLIDDTSTYTESSSAAFSLAQTHLSATWSSATDSALQLTLYFKITDAVNEYELHLKHWKAAATGVKLTLVINNNPDQSITKVVDDLEGEGGSNNVLSIALRDLDFASIDYHDYLQLGLNAVAITIEPLDASSASSCEYQLRALAIVKS